MIILQNSGVCVIQVSILRHAAVSPQFYWKQKMNLLWECLCLFCKVTKAKTKSEVKSLESIIAVAQEKNTGLKERYKILREIIESRRMAI